jgi:hypothetical protein
MLLLLGAFCWFRHPVFLHVDLDYPSRRSGDDDQRQQWRQGWLAAALVVLLLLLLFSRQSQIYQASIALLSVGLFLYCAILL